MKAERQYLGHFIDAAFDATYAACAYVRLGDDLEEFNEELNPDVETKEYIRKPERTAFGIRCEFGGFPYYYSYDDELSEKIMDIAMSRRREMHVRPRR
ncbi:MAG: hypothetical protein ACLRMZ_13700 [Blautia marasmi]